MKKLLGRRPSPALVIAMIALFASLGGVSYAVSKGSIGSKEIENNSVRGKDLRNNTVPARKIRRAVRADLDTRWALVNEAGQIERQTGGFNLVDCFQTNDNCYIDAGGDLRDNGLQVQIAVQNTDGPGAAMRLSGEAGVAPCGAEFVACAPPNTEANDVLVVAPRQSDGTAAPADNRFRFYVFVTGSEAR